MKTLVLKLSLLTLILLVAAKDVQAQVSWYVPRPPSRSRSSWYTVKPPKTAATQKQATVPVVILSPAQAAAKAELDRMAAALNGAEGIQYDTTVSYPSGQAGKTTMVQTTASVLVERHIRLSIHTTNNGQTEGAISADGTKFTLYDASKNDYVQITTTSDLPSLQDALELAGKQVFPKQSSSSRDLRRALDFPMLFLGSVYDLSRTPTGDTLTYTQTAGTSDDSKAVTVVTMTETSPKVGSLAVSYLIDPATNLPVQFSEIQTELGKSPSFNIVQTFKSLKLIHKALPVTAYNFTLPAGATMAPAEAKVIGGP